MNRWRALLLYNGFFFIMVAVFIGFSLSSPYFLTTTNLFSLLHSAAPWIVFASGLALVIMTHHIDISVGSIAFLSAVVGFTLLVRLGFSPWLSLPLVFLTGLGTGLLNGVLVARLKINPFIVTLSTMMAFRGIGLQIVKGRTISIPAWLSNLGSLRLGPVYFDTILSLLFLLFLHLIRVRTPFGRYIMAVGSDPEVSKRMGVNVERMVLLAFVLSGLLASFGGFLLVLQLGVVSLRMGIGMEFIALASIVIGGISLFGGEGSLIPGLLFGVYTLNIIDSGLNYLGASPYMYPFVRGGLIFLAMYLDALRHALQAGARSVVKSGGKLF